MSRFPYRFKFAELYTFLIGFIAFAFQIFSVKIVEFLKYDIHFFDKFVTPLYGMAFGAYLYNVYRWPRSILLRSLSLLLVVFIFNTLFGWRFLFLPLLFLIFIFLGAALLDALSFLPVRRALIIDTVGGICGLVFAYYSIQLISIELQILVMSAVLLGLLYMYKKRSFDFILIGFGCFYIYQHQAHDTFNFIRAQESIPSRYKWFQDTMRNGQYAVRQFPESYLGGKWTEFDRVDLARDQHGTVRAYLNNELYMEFAKEVPQLVPVIGKNVHVVGFGLGEEIHSLSVSSYENIVSSEISSYLFALGKENLKTFKGPNLQLKNEDGFLLSEDYPNYFDLVWAVFPSAVANYSSLTKSSNAGVTVEAFEQMYGSLREGGFLVTALHFYPQRKVNWAGTSTIYKFLIKNGLDINKHLATLYMANSDRVRIYYLVKKGEISTSDLQQFYNWRPQLCSGSQCGDNKLISAYENQVKDLKKLLDTYPPFSRERLVFGVGSELLSNMMWIILIFCSCAGMAIAYQKKLLFSRETVGVFPFLSGALAAIFQLYLSSAYVFFLKLPALSYLLATFLFLVGGAIGYLFSSRAKTEKGVLIGSLSFILSVAVLIFNFTNPYVMTHIQIVAATMALSLPFIVFNSSFYATYVEQRNFLVCYSVNIMGFLIGLLGALICTRYLGIHQLVYLILLLWVSIAFCIYKKL